MNTFADLLISPIGPPLILLLGALAQLVVGRSLRRPDLLTGLALFFVATAGLLILAMRAQTAVVPTFSRPWRPILQDGANLYWIGDGWNWYIAGLILLLGGVGILLDLNSDLAHSGRRVHGHLALQLGVLAAALLFVQSGNLLTVALTWVLLDVSMLLRTTTRPSSSRLMDEESYSGGLSLLGAMLIFVALLPAGPSGPGQPLQGGDLPVETVLLLAVAAVMRAGAYPFHLWLLSDRRPRLYVSELLLEQMTPALCGLWFLGWVFSLGQSYNLLGLEVLAFFVLAFLGSALAAWTAKGETAHQAFVLITSANLVALIGVLAFSRGPEAMIWPTTAFALGGALWLVGEQVWRGWGWQIPVSVGALTLAGVPFTPGFLAQRVVAELFVSQLSVLLIFLIYLAGQSLQMAALLRSYEEVQRQEPLTLPASARVRLLIASVALGLPLAVSGFLPRTLAAIASMPTAIPAEYGSRPTVIGDTSVWVAWLVPVLLGFALIWGRPRLPRFMDDWFGQIHRMICLEWLFQFGWWGLKQSSELWGNATYLVEGAGYMGWLLVFILVGYLLAG